MAIVAIIVVVSAIAAVYILTRPAVTVCSVSSTNPLIFDQPETPDSLDTAFTFTTPGWGVVQQVYQELVMYNGSSYTTFLPVLAKSWTESTDHMNITFHLRSGVHFSNAHAFNAYVMWFSLYRTLVMNQAPTFILSNNFGFPHTNATSDPSDIANETAIIENYLNTGDFQSPNATLMSAMTNPDQSFQVIDNLTIQLNLGRGALGPVAYPYIYATLAAPVAAALDPQYVKAHGGVSNTSNDWMTTHALGTGPYMLPVYDKSATSYTLRVDTNYWGATAASKETWNNALQSAKRDIEIDKQSDPAITTNDLKSGRVVGASFAYLGPSTVNNLKGLACLNVQPLDVVYGSTAGAWWIYMDQQHAPFNNWSVRAAVSHAINYDRIIQLAFGGNAARWVGPVPPGYPNYNPSNLTPYSYDLRLARQYMNNSPYPLTSVNPVQGGYPTPVKYAYVDLGDWPEVATLLQDDLAKIGITLVPTPITFDNLYEEQSMTGTVCTTDTTTNGGPFYMGQEFYTSDYISPDDWTFNDAISWGSANVCASRYANDTVDKLVSQAASETDATAQRQQYAQMTRIMYDNYSNVWLVSPTQFAVSNQVLKGVVSNPMGSALPFTMLFNSEYT